MELSTENAVKSLVSDVDNIPTLGAIQLMSFELLAAIANGDIDFAVLARQELASRGVDKDGEWVTFRRAKSIWLGEAK